MKNSIWVKRRNDATLFITTSSTFLPTSTLKEIETHLQSPVNKHVVFYFNEKGDKESASLKNLCRLLIKYPTIHFKIFKRKNILFLQRPFGKNKRLIRTQQGRIISSPQSFLYEGSLFKPNSRLYDIFMTALKVDQPRTVQISFPVKKSNENNTAFSHHIEGIRFLILKEIQEKNHIQTIQFYAYRNQKKELTDSYIRHTNLEIRKISPIPVQKISQSQPPSPVLSPVPISKYQRRLFAREQKLKQAVNDN